jgi:transcriptional regulator GlxA family with amidase domain
VTPADDDLADTLRFMLDNLDAPLTVARLAAHAHMSARTFARRFHAVTGSTPHQWLLNQRLLLARQLLESTDTPVERVAARAGFGSPATLRHHFQRVLDVSPLRYRQTFRTATSA